MSRCLLDNYTGRFEALKLFQDGESYSAGQKMCVRSLFVMSITPHSSLFTVQEAEM